MAHRKKQQNHKTHVRNKKKLSCFFFYLNVKIRLDKFVVTPEGEEPDNI